MCYAANIILTRNIIRMDMLSLDSDGRDDLEDESSIWENPSRIVIGETPINFTYPTQYLISEIRFDNKDTQDGRGREYYGDQHSGEYLLCTWKDGMKNGDGILYNKYGEVIFRGMFVNDYIEGDGYIFKDGVIVAKCRFTRSQMNSFCYIECTPKHVIMVEKSSRGYYRYRGGFNEATNGREGYGAEYGEDGRLSHYGVYESNVLIQKNKLFKGNIMQELDEEEHTVYIGHYKDDLDTGFPREGEGREYQDGILLFKGTYLNGERNGPGTIYHKHGIAKIKGVWKNGELIEQHEIDDAGYYKDLTFDGRSDSFVQFVGGMGTFSLHVKHVKLANGMCNKENLTRLQFTNINQLRTIDIGSNCFRYVQTVTISNLNSLQSIEIGDDSFTLFNRTTNLPSDPSNEAYTLKDKCICCISDCKQLEIIRMGPGSFSSFSSFSVTNLPSLKTLAIGKLYTETVPSEKCSYCFFWASRFVLSGWIGYFLFRRPSLSLLCGNREPLLS